MSIQKFLRLKDSFFQKILKIELNDTYRKNHDLRMHLLQYCKYLTSFASYNNL